MTLVLEWKGWATCAWLDFRITSEHDCHLLSILPFSEQKHLLPWSLPVSRLHVGWMWSSKLSLVSRPRDWEEVHLRSLTCVWTWWRSHNAGVGACWHSWMTFLISWEGMSAFWCRKNINHSDQSTDFKLWTQMPPIPKYILFCNVTLSFLPSRIELISSLLESDLALYWLWSILQHKWLYIIWF